MLEVQKYLSEYGLEKLQEEFAIKATFKDDMMLLNYSQIDSPKTHPIVRNCRGLCLNKNDYSLISRSFYRFFNYGENQEGITNFDWDNCSTQSKEDGSLCHVFFHNGKWEVCTRASFGDIPFYTGGPTPRELFYQARPTHFRHLNEYFSYSFELCSVHNKIVRHYPTPTLYLLSIFWGFQEFGLDEIEEELKKINQDYAYVKLPDEWQFYSIGEVEKHIREVSKNDKTFEGVVVRDRFSRRVKVKNPDYLCLHRLKGENSNLFMPKNLLPFILSGDTDELYTYFSEVKPQVEQMKKILDSEFISCLSVWNAIRYSATRKEFALAIPPTLKTKSLLFTALDTGRPLKDLWSESADLLLKALF